MAWNTDRGDGTHFRGQDLLFSAHKLPHLFPSQASAFETRALKSGEVEWAAPAEPGSGPRCTVRVDGARPDVCFCWPERSATALFFFRVFFFVGAADPKG